MPTDVSQVHRWSATRVARRSLVSELAAALQLPERTTENLIEESRSLLCELPATMTALAEGDINYWHAQVIIDHATSQAIDARRPFERAALPFALTLTASRFDSRARVSRERVHPESIEVRHAISRDKRELSVDSARDGMAWLPAYLPAASVQAIYNRVADVAAGLHSPVEPHTFSQLRADIFCDLLLDGVTAESHPTHPNLGTDVRARVLVTVPVPVLSLLGRSAEPAVVEGYGPIDIDTARELAAGAPGPVRILTYPETGAVLSLGRDRCAISPDLRAWLRMRDETCRAPGCGADARCCDLDHTKDWQYHGLSNHDNLAHLCPKNHDQKHHDQKHHTGWTVEHIGEGDLEWVSPTGRRYVTEPATRIAVTSRIEPLLRSGGRGCPVSRDSGSGRS